MHQHRCLLQAARQVLRHWRLDELRMKEPQDWDRRLKKMQLEYKLKV